MNTESILGAVTRGRGQRTFLAFLLPLLPLLTLEVSSEAAARSGWPVTGLFLSVPVKSFIAVLQGSLPVDTLSEAGTAGVRVAVLSLLALSTATIVVVVILGSSLLHHHRLGGRRGRGRGELTVHSVLPVTHPSTGVPVEAGPTGLQDQLGASTEIIFLTVP